MKRPTPKHKILCCDPSLTAFGWAVTEGNTVIASGCLKTKTSDKKLRIRKSDDRMNRVSFICTSLRDIIREHDVSFIVSELPHGSQSAVAAIALGLIAGAVQGIADALEIGLEWYSEGESKQYLLGKRSATKDATINAIAEIYGEEWRQKAKSTNEAIADALAIHNCAKKLSPTVKLFLKNL